MTGNMLYKCAMKYDQIVGSGYLTSTSATTVEVLEGETVARRPGGGAGTQTNVMFRSDNTQDPHVGCEGGFWSNVNKLLWAEGGKSGRTDFKNNNNGVSFWVRALADPGRPKVFSNRTSSLTS